MENEEKKEMSLDEVSNILNDPMTMAMAKNPIGRKILIKQATKMLKNARPDLSEEEIKEITAIATTGDLKKLEDVLIEKGVFKNE